MYVISYGLEAWYVYERLNKNFVETE